MADPQPDYVLPGSYHKLDCGCEFWNELLPGTTFTVYEGKAITSPPDGALFMIRPCSLTCQYYQYALAENQDQGNKIEFREE